MRSRHRLCCGTALTVFAFIFMGCDAGAGGALADAPELLAPDAALARACGDGALDAGEACDDGNLDGGDGCSAQCQVEICGNGVVDLGEQCDDGNDRPADACFDCQGAAPVLCDGPCDLGGTAGGAPALQTLTPDDGAPGDRFGASVALSGDVALVGAYEDDGGRGSAYVFTRDAQGQWRQTQTLTADDGAAGDRFGWSVALSGDVALIWAGNGSADLFTRDAHGRWVQTQTLTADDSAAGDVLFGSVALSGDVALIAGTAHHNGADRGAAYFFTRDAQGQWVQTQRVTADGPAGALPFGQWLALSGNVALVAAPGSMVNGVRSAAYVYARDAQGRWRQTQKLRTNESDILTVALSGDVALVGEGSFVAGSGAAHLFTRDAQGQWVPTQTFTADDSAPHFFGWSVALSGDVALVGAGTRVGEGYDSTASLYRRDASGQWRQTQVLTANGFPFGDFFHDTLALSGHAALLGGTSPAPHSAYFFDLAGPRCFDDGACVCLDGADDLRCAGRPDCGDGTTQAAEQCDDGNRVPGDGCDAHCDVEH